MDLTSRITDRAVTCLKGLPAVTALRISVGFWTTEDELDRFLAGVRLLAAHDPASLPPRRTLTIVGQD